MDQVLTSPEPQKLQSFLSLLPSSVMAEIYKAGSIRLYQDGQTIHQRGDHKPGLSIVLSGAVQMGTSDLAGKTVTSVLRKEGESFGELTLFANLPRPLDAQAMGPTRISKISRSAFFGLMDREPQLRETVLTNLAHQLAVALDHIDGLRRLPLRERLAKTLLEFAVRSGGGDNAYVKITHAQLADSMGVTRVSIATALGSLLGLNLISKSYGQIDIPNTAALMKHISAWEAV